jgi:hypothetical protein
MQPFAFYADNQLQQHYTLGYGHLVLARNSNLRICGMCGDSSRQRSVHDLFDKTYGEQALRPRGKTVEGHPPRLVGHAGIGEGEFVTVVGLLVRERCFESKHDLVAARSVE